MASRGEASGHLQSPGDAVVVERGIPRWLVMSCPCGCREQIPLNLDSRAGPAWRLYRHPKFGTNLYPSVWRDTGCGSHFIVWRNSILLFGTSQEEFGSIGRADEIAALSERVRNSLHANQFRSCLDIADQLGEIPWDVLDACRYLARRGLAKEGTGLQKGTFRRS